MSPLIHAPMPLIGALLNGGTSRRMGHDKALLELAGEPLFRRPARVLAASCEVCVQVGGAALPCLGWPVVPDLRPDAGPAAGIEAALTAFPGAAVLVCGVDVPFVEGELMRRLVTTLGTGPMAVVPRHADRWHPLTAAWSPQALPPLTAWLERGERALQAFLDQLPATPLPDLEQLGEPDWLLFNVNSPSDLEAARRRLEATGRP